MKRINSLILIIVVSALFLGCEDGKSESTISSNMDISNVPTVINRAILIDALWGEGEEIPQNEACVAESQFVFSSTSSPFSISKNAMENEYFTTPYIVTSSLNIQIPESGDTRGASCAAGTLNYILSASTDLPVDIELIGESCPALENSADKAYPPTGSATAHFESEEVTRTIGECDSESESDLCIKDTKKMFKLVIDSCQE